ncbi:MAG: haloacid dehalogenase type II [Candidatus Aenigmarchaeota archaeon]|nr:haloacid dehalogenase type II [Candidatus Aenigmarchaeota archaeon]
MAIFSEVKALTFDFFGTILDLGGSLTPYIAGFLKSKGSDETPNRFWEKWRYRQRIEQYQDTIMMMGHSGYHEAARRGLVWTLKLYGISFSTEEIMKLMEAWKELSPFPEVVPALERLKTRYKLVALSNGEPHFLDHLAKNRIQWNFDNIISVEVMGAFKPHPGVYRRAAAILELEVGECMMVSSNSFDVVGARSCGFRGAFVDRYGLPYEDTSFLPDVTVNDFTGLADALMEQGK